MKPITGALAAVTLFQIGLVAQPYVISTYAGGAPPPTPAPGVQVAIGSVSGITTDPAGNVYFASSTLNSVFKLDADGILTRVAGNSRSGFSGDGGPATGAQLQLSVGLASYIPAGVAVDSAGNLFIADTGNARVRKVSPEGIITTVAGNGVSGFSGDGGPATSAQLSYPTGVAVDSTGNLFIADLGNNRVRQVDPSGIITTLAGTDVKGFSGDGGPATAANLNQPRGVAVDSTGNLYIADAYNFCVRKISPSGIITTVAGNGTRGLSSDGVPATQLDFPTRVAVDSAGNLFIADGGRIRRVAPDGIITTAAGAGTCCSSGDGGPAINAQLVPVDVAVDGAGNLFIAVPGAIRKVSSDTIITTVAGDGMFGYTPSPLLPFSGDGGPATDAQLNTPRAVALDGAGNLFIADTGNGRIRKVSRDGIITTVAGSVTSAQLRRPSSVAVDGAGNLFILDTDRVRKVAPDQTVTTVAGGGPDAAGDGGPATNAQLLYPTGVAVDGLGNLFIADASSNRVRKVSPTGIITTAAGNGKFGSSGDGGAATGAQLNGPVAIAIDADGDLFIAEFGRVRKVSPDGIITTIAGGDPATGAYLSYPSGIAVDAAGNLFIADPGASFVDSDFYGEDSRIRRVSPDGNTTTVAGNGTLGYSGDEGPATGAVLNHPAGLAVDRAGNIYVADADNNAVRVLRPANPVSR